MEYFLLSCHFQLVCVPESEVGLLKTAYIWILFLYPFSQLCLLVGAFSPFTFKVIIDLYVLIAILLTILDLFLLLFFLLLFSCDLMTIFNVVFEFIFLICLCINCRFFLYNDFYFFHYSWLIVFCQFSTAQQGDLVTHTCIHSLL